MSFSTALYEGDSVIHRQPRARAPSKARAAAVKRTAPAPTPLESSELGSAELNGWSVLIGAAWNALRSVALWIDEKSREAHYRRIDSYLAQSTDHADLERRMRDLERSSQLNWIDCGSR
jgi:hypothetical protein